MRKRLLQASWLLCLSVFFIGSSYAQSSLKIADEDKDLKIEGFWNEDDNTLSGYIQVTSQGGSGSLQVLSYDLVHDKNPIRKITRDMISIEEGVDLESNVPTNVRVEIANIPAEGKYTGKIKLYTNGNVSGAVEVPVTVNATLYHPDRIATDDSIDVHIIGSPWFSFMLPHKYREKEFAVTLHNNGQSPVVIKDYSFYAKGGDTKQEIDNDQFVLTQALPLEIEANSRQTLRFQLKQKGQSVFKRYVSITPDSYRGDLLIRFTEDSEAAPVKIEMDMNSRAGMLMVLLALLAGIILGKIIKDMSSGKAKAQLALMGEFTQQLSRIKQLESVTEGNDYGMQKEYDKVVEVIGNSDENNQDAAHSAMNAFSAKLDMFFGLMDFMDKIKLNNNYSEKEKNQNSDAVLSLMSNVAMGSVAPSQIDERINMLKKAWKTRTGLRKLMDEAAGDTDMEESIAYYSTQVNLAETNIVEGDPKEEVDAELAELQNGIDTDILGKSGGTRGVGPAVPKDEPKDNAATVEVETKKESFLAKIGKALWSVVQEPLKYTFFLLMDMKEPNANVRFWFFRPLLTFITLAYAIMTGISETYLDNPVFGVNGFSDYGELVLWGVGSKITASTIGDFGEAAASKVGNNTGASGTMETSGPSDFDAPMDDEF